MSRVRRRIARTLGAVHVAQAALLLSRSRRIPRVLGGDEQPPPAWLVRALGVRLLVQGVAEAVHPERRLLALGAAVDITHALSMVAAAKLRPAHHRAALTSAASSTASALVSGVTAALCSQRRGAPAVLSTGLIIGCH